jgi:hypothetical protein
MWKEEIINKKFWADNESKLKELEEKLRGAKSTQSDNTKKVMMRMNAGSDAALLGMCFQAIVSFHQDYLKDKEMEDKVKLAEQRVAQFMNEHSDSAKKVLQSISGGTDTGLLQFTLKAWIQLWTEAKEEAEMAEVLQKHQKRMTLFQDRNKENGRSVGQKASFYIEERLMLGCFGCWKLDTKMELTLRKYQLKIDAKRQQLLGVQQMFRKFAVQLEGSLKEGGDTNRDLREAGGHRKKQLQKSDGTVSLPDINQKQTTPKISSGNRTPSARIRTPTGGAAYPANQEQPAA